MGKPVDQTTLAYIPTQAIPLPFAFAQPRRRLPEHLLTGRNTIAAGRCSCAAPSSAPPLCLFKVLRREVVLLNGNNRSTLDLISSAENGKCLDGLPYSTTPVG
jgi:hypothetical protein